MHGSGGTESTQRGARIRITRNKGEQMIVDHAAAAKRADAREKAYAESLAGTNELPVAMTMRFCNMEVREEAMLRRLAAVEAQLAQYANRHHQMRLAESELNIQNLINNRIGALEQWGAENRLAAVEQAQAILGKQLVNVACHTATAADTQRALDRMQRQLDQTEARLAQYAMRLAESDVNLQDCMDRIVAMEKKR